MPDPTRRTLSATQIPGLFNQSPYVTEFMLYHWAKGNMDLDLQANTRMTWGKRLQSVIILAAAEQMQLQVNENVADEYRRMEAHRIGYTADADIYDPGLGIGAVEAKNVDGLIYRNEWADDAAPAHIELQLQSQILVLQEKYGTCNWGIIPVLVGGNELVIHRRLPNPEQQQLIKERVAQFWLDVEANREPDAFGSPREVPGLKQMYAETVPGKVIDAPGLEAHELVQEYEHHKERRLEHEKLEDAAKIKLMALGQDAQILNTQGFEVEFRRTKIAKCTRTINEHMRVNLKIRRVDL